MLFKQILLVNIIQKKDETKLAATYQYITLANNILYKFISIISHLHNVTLQLDFMNNNNIHTTFEHLLSRSDKEILLNQNAAVFWLTGLSGSGKSTLTQRIEKKLHQQGFFTVVLDGDNVRSGLNNNLGFSEADRSENIRRIAEVAKLFLNAGVITFCCFVSPTVSIRKMAQQIVGETNFYEIYVNASFAECEKRDVKGLYKKARNGEIKNFTGLDAPFEAPMNPFLEIDTSKLSIEESVELMYNQIISIIKK